MKMEIILGIGIFLVFLITLPQLHAIELPQLNHNSTYSLYYSQAPIEFYEAVRQWYNWFITVPAAHNAFFDETGRSVEHYNNATHSTLYFLTGKADAPGRRDVTVFANQSIFFPTIESHYTYQGTGIYALASLYPGFTENKLLKQDDTDTVYYQAAFLDGMALPTYRVKAFYNVDYREGNILQIEGKQIPTLVDGYWSYLKPMAAGHHVIQMVGMDDHGYKSEVTYNVEVKDR